MTPKVIRIVIEEIVEDGEKYYLAKSPDVQGFLAETETLDEMLKVAPEVMEMILELDKEIEEENHPQKNLWQKVIYDINYNTKLVSHLQYA
jgi:predicted RNase H-like HicB family nuclease